MDLTGELSSSSDPRSLSLSLSVNSLLSFVVYQLNRLNIEICEEVQPYLVPILSNARNYAISSSISLLTRAIIVTSSDLFCQNSLSLQ